MTHPSEAQPSHIDDLECNKIADDEEEFPNRKAAYLLKEGWHRTCDTVGSYWMWFRAVTTDVYERGAVIGQKTTQYGCSLNDAFRIQRTLDCLAYEIAHPEQVNDD